MNEENNTPKEEKVEETTPTSEENPTPKESETPKETDTDFKKELETLEATKPKEQPKRSEEEKAKFTIDKIHERFPNLKEEEPDAMIDEDKISAVESRLENKFERNQVEGIFRANSKTEEEVKYKMFFYDNRIAKSGNIHDDADDAEWLANKARTRNAIKEMKQNPDSPGSSTGAGQKPTSNSVPTLPPIERKRLLDLGMKEVSPGRWEGKSQILEWNTQAKSWEQKRKVSA